MGLEPPHLALRCGGVVVLLWALQSDQASLSLKDRVRSTGVCDPIPFRGSSFHLHPESQSFSPCPQLLAIAESMNVATSKLTTSPSALCSPWQSNIISALLQTIWLIVCFTTVCRSSPLTDTLCNLVLTGLGCSSTKEHVSLAFEGGAPMGKGCALFRTQDIIWALVKENEKSLFYPGCLVFIVNLAEIQIQLVTHCFIGPRLLQ